MKQLNIPKLIGVKHRLIHLDETIETLKQFDLKDKKVMIEITDYPIPNKEWEFDHEFCEFYDLIAKFVLERSGRIIPGDSEILVERTIQKLLDLTYMPRLQYNNGPNSVNQDFGSLCDLVYCEERDPHFLQKILETQPHIVILGEKHIYNLLTTMLKHRTFYS